MASLGSVPYGAPRSRTLRQLLQWAWDINYVHKQCEQNLTVSWQSPLAFKQPEEAF